MKKTNQEAQKRLRQGATLLVGAVITGLFAGLFLLPEIVSCYWHARFGDVAIFHEWRVPVPRGWWAFTRNDQLILQKMVRFYSREDPPAIIVDTLIPGKPVDPEALQEALLHALSKQGGYIYQEGRAVLVGADPCYCVQLSADKNPTISRISCASPAAQLSFDLFGRKSENNTFYLVVRNTRRYNPH